MASSSSSSSTVSVRSGLASSALFDLWEVVFMMIGFPEDVQRYAAVCSRTSRVIDELKYVTAFFVYKNLAIDSDLVSGSVLAMAARNGSPTIKEEDLPKLEHDAYIGRLCWGTRLKDCFKDVSDMKMLAKGEDRGRIRYTTVHGDTHVVAVKAQMRAIFLPSCHNASRLALDLADGIVEGALRMPESYSSRACRLSHHFRLWHFGSFDASKARKLMDADWRECLAGYSDFLLKLGVPESKRRRV